MEVTGEKVKQLRINARLSQSELAKRAGYTDRSSIAKIEAGLVDLSESKLKVLAKALNVTPLVLMGLDEQPAAVDPERQALIDELSDLSTEDLRAMLNFIKSLKGK